MRKIIMKMIAINCDYFNPDEFIKAKFNSTKEFSIFHLNIHSIQLHIEQLKNLLIIHNYKFDVIAISESKLLKGSKPLIDITIDGYHEPIGTGSEANKGGVILYISNHLNFKPRPDLEIYSPKK